MLCKFYTLNGILLSGFMVRDLWLGLQVSYPAPTRPMIGPCWINFLGESSTNELFWVTPNYTACLDLIFQEKKALHFKM